MSNRTRFAVRKFMRSPVITVNLDGLVADVADLMIEHNIGSVVVVDDAGNMRGMVTEGMFMPKEELFPFVRGTVTRLMGTNVGSDHSTSYYDAIAEVRSKTVQEVMDHEPEVVHPDTTIDKVIETIAEAGGYHVPVVENGKPVGMIARHDLMQLFSG